MRLKYLIRKEFTQILHDSFLPRLVVMFPIALICIAPWVTSMEVRDVRVCFVDNDGSTLSRRLIERTKHSQYFVVAGRADSYAEAMDLMKQGKTDVVAVVPRHYGRDAEKGGMPQVMVAANSVNGTKGMMGASYLSSTIAQNISSLRPAATTLGTAGLRVTEKKLYNPYEDYKLFMIPALMTILVVMMCGFLPALNIVGEKEKGTIEQINVTPVRKWEFILAKLIPYWIIGLLVFTISLLLSRLVYGFAPASGALALYLPVMLLALVMSGLGLVVSNYSSQMQQAMFVMWFFMVCFILLSGLFTPVQSMPEWAQRLTLVNPIRWFIDAMRTLYVRGGTLAGTQTQLIVLAAFAVVIDTWALVSYKKNDA